MTLIPGQQMTFQIGILFSVAPQTLQTMLTAAKKGRPVNEAEIPPPVATGAHSTNSGSAVLQRPAPPVPSRPPPDSSPPGQPVQSRPDASREEEEEEESSSSAEATPSAAPSPEEMTGELPDQPETAGL